MDEVLEAVQSWLGARVTLRNQIINGEEAEVWVVSTSSNLYVVHVLSAPWRTADDLAWCHRVAARAARSVPEVVAPVRSGEETFTNVDGRLVTVYPFIEGGALDRDDMEQVRQAGRLLARIHRALRDWDGGHRPSPHSTPGEQVRDLEDRALDEKWAAASERTRLGLCHGDYYRRNIIVAQHQRDICGVIDWHEAYIGPLIGEVAWSAWEFGHDEEMRLVSDRFELFVDAYRAAADGLIPDWEFELIPTAARVMLRENIRLAIERGASPSEEYQRRQIRAFHRLRAQLS